MKPVLVVHHHAQTHKMWMRDADQLQAAADTLSEALSSYKPYANDHRKTVTIATFGGYATYVIEKIEGFHADFAGPEAQEALIDFEVECRIRDAEIERKVSEISLVGKLVD